MKSPTLLITASLAIATAVASAQVIVGTTTAPTAPTTDVEVSYGATARYPANYDFYRQSPYALSPYIAPVIVPAKILRPQVPAMQPYSDLEYGQLMQTSLEAAPVQASSARATTASIVLQAESEQNGLPEGTAAARVVDVLDRGTLVLDTYEEIRLRGVAVPSVSDRDEVVRYYARTAADAIRRLTRETTVYVKLGTPERDSSGILLADVYLEDGSFLNRKVLELGYGRFDTEHFLPGTISVTLQAAEIRAREAKLGIFSKN